MKVQSNFLKKAGIIGASGRMGQEILKVLHQNNSCELEPYLSWSRRLGDIKSKVNTHDFRSCPEIRYVDVWMDFSLADNFENVTELLTSHPKPLVSGVTGLSPEQFEKLNQISKSIPVLWASNTSIGINFILSLLEKFTAIRDFDFQIDEIHHNQKLDRPSGTAIALQTKLVTAVGKKIPDPLSTRGGGVFGDHKIFAISEDEMITIEHRAMNRTVFAKGAVRAAEWLVNQRSGLYTMRDVLGV